MAAATLSSLLSKSWEFFVKRIGVIVASSIVVGIIIAVIQFAFASNVRPYAQDAINSTGFDIGRVQELQQRVQRGDMNALQELQKATENAAKNIPQNPQEAAKTLPHNFFRIGAIASVVGIVVGLILFAFQFFILLLVLENKSTKETLERLKSLYLPLLGLAVIAIIVSFIWIPIPGINIVIGIIISSRLILSPIILIKKRDGGIIRSIKQSWELSAGYWGKLIGNLLTVGIIFMIVPGAIASLLKTSSVGSFLLLIISTLFGAFIVIFCTKIAQTILDNPKLGFGHGSRTSSTSSSVAYSIAFEDRISRWFIFRSLWLFIECWVLMVWGLWFIVVSILHFWYMLILGRRSKDLWDAQMHYFRHTNKWKAYLMKLANGRPKFIED